jgi:predicted transglutaminase-like cysteine proteinase
METLFIRQYIGMVLLVPMMFLASCVSEPSLFRLGDEVQPPPGCIELRRRGGECSLIKELQKVLDRIARKYSPQANCTLYDDDDYWATVEESTRGDRIVGDCEDFAIQVRQELGEMDIPSRLVLCRMGHEYHLVVEVDGWILDNRHVWVIPRDELDYEWIKISGYCAGEPWRRVLR